MPGPRWRWTLVLMACGLVVACSAPEAEKAGAGDASLTPCVEPRPEICTAHYDPVCGVRDDGTVKTYANACSACGDAAVAGHRPGACE